MYVYNSDIVELTTTSRYEVLVHLDIFTSSPLGLGPLVYGRITVVLIFSTAALNL